MINKGSNRRSVIAGAEGLRNRVREIAHGRDHDNFSHCLSSGPFGGVALVDNAQTLHSANGDEASEPYAGNFSKGLLHDSNSGLVKTPADYADMVKRLEAVRANSEFPDPGSMASIDGVRRAPVSAPDKPRPFTNPLSSLAGGGSGIDSMDVRIPPAPRLASRQAGIELVELYWMALLRDAPIDAWDQNALAGEAANELNQLNQVAPPEGEERFAQHYTQDGHLSNSISVQRLFRGSAPGDDTGPYISQLLLQDIPYGTLSIEQKQFRLASDNNYLDSWEPWLLVQNGVDATRNRQQLEDRSRPARHIVTLRDLAHYVHFDALHEAYFNAALILDGLRAPLSATNPYNENPHQEGFGVYGGPHVLVAVTEAATRALRAVWFQKWMVHRRLRPEAMAARAEYQRLNKGVDLVDPLIIDSQASALTLQSQQNVLLSQVFPEGSPMHPSYGAGHATVAGACTTILKAFFDNNSPMPVVQRVSHKADGSTVLTDSDQVLSVGGEINKLAANIAIGRNGAGVHYRTDYTKSMSLGEAVAIGLLQEQAMELKEGKDKDDTAFEFVNFSGQNVSISYAGKVSCGGVSKTSSGVQRTKGLFADY